MKKIVTIVLIVIMILGILLPALAMASDVDGNQQKLNEVNKDIKNVEEKIKENQSEKAKVENELVQLDKQLQEANKELERTQNQLNTTNRNLEEAKGQLNDAIEDMNLQNELLNERVRVMYKNGHLGYLDVLLNATSFSDFISRIDAVRTIMNYDFELLESLEQQKIEIEAKKESIEREQQRIITLKNQLEHKTKEVQTLQVSRQNHVQKIETDINEYKKQMDQLESDAAEVTRIIQAAERRRQEEERRRQEEERRRQEEERRRQEEERKKQEQTSQNQQTPPTNNGNTDNSGSNNNSNNSGSNQNSSSQLLWPVPGYNTISSPYGMRTHPIFRDQRMHTGIDIPAPTGTPFIAPGDGVVTYAGYMGGYGNTVIVDLGGGISILGAHNSSLLVSAGQRVSRGQTIARIGSTGNSTGPHLHFEVRRNGNHINPLPFIR